MRQSPSSTQPTPRMSTRNALYDTLLPTASPLLAPLSLEPPTRSHSRHAGNRKRNQAHASNLPEDFLAAIEELNSRNGDVSGGVAWKPSVSTAKLAQRRFALQLCGWSLAQDELAQAIKM